MIKKTMRRITAGAMAAAMVLATPVVAGAASSGTPTTSGTAASIYYKENVETIVVPTTLAVAFNPNGLNVTVGPETTTDQVVSRTVALVSEATKDKKVSVSFAVSASDASKIKFVDSESALTANTDCNVFLQLAAADAGEVSVYSGSTSGTKTIGVNGSGSLTVSQEELSKAKMTTGTSGTVAIKDGTKVNFLLGAATYTYDPIDLESYSGSNKVSGKLSSLSVASGTGSSQTSYAGVTGFKLTGKLNTKADWYSLSTSDTITITPTYKIADKGSSDTVIVGTGALIGTEAGSGTSSSSTTAPNFTAVAKGFTYNTAGITSITKAELTNSAGTFDGMAAVAGAYDGATSTADATTGVTTVKFADNYAAFYTGTVAAKITYVDKDGETQTTTLNIVMD